MAKIEVSKEHTLSRADLEPRIEEYLNRLRDDKFKMMGFNYSWKEGRNGIAITGKGFTGDVVLRETGVDLTLDLGMMLAPFKGTVEESIKRGLDKYLA